MIWHAQAINGLDPLTGKELWSIGLEPLYGMSIMAPRQHGDKLFAGGHRRSGRGAQARRRQGHEPVWQETTAKEKGFATETARSLPGELPPRSSRTASSTASISPGMLRGGRARHRQEALVHLQAGDRQGRGGGLQERGLGDGVHRQERRPLLPLRRDRATSSSRSSPRRATRRSAGPRSSSRPTPPSAARWSGATRPSPTSASSSATTRRSSA